MNRIHAAWRASTEWIERAATTSGRWSRFGPWPAYAATPVSSSTCDVILNLSWFVTVSPKSNFGFLTAFEPRMPLSVLTCVASCAATVVANARTSGWVIAPDATACL